jgi:hypothetical protein
MKTHLINMAKGTAQQNLSPAETLKTEIAFDSTVINEYVEIIAPAFWTIAENYKESNRLATLRNALLPRLISGDLAIIGHDA